MWSTLFSNPADVHQGFILSIWFFEINRMIISSKPPGVTLFCIRPKLVGIYVVSNHQNPSSQSFIARWADSVSHLFCLQYARRIIDEPPFQSTSAWRWLASTSLGVVFWIFCHKHRENLLWIAAFINPRNESLQATDPKYEDPDSSVFTHLQGYPLLSALQQISELQGFTVVSSAYPKAHQFLWFKPLFHVSSHFPTSME